MEDRIIHVGDRVRDRITGTELEVVDVFRRDGVLIAECTDNHGHTTTAQPNWLYKHKP